MIYAGGLKFLSHTPCALHFSARFLCFYPSGHTVNMKVFSWIMLCLLIISTLMQYPFRALLVKISL